MKYALIINNAIAEYRNYDAPLISVKMIDGKPMLRPVTFVPANGYDSRIHTKSVQTVIGDTEVTETEVLTERPIAAVQKDHKAHLRGQMFSQLEQKYDWPEVSMRQSRGIKFGAADPQFVALMNDQVALFQAYNTAAASVDAAQTVAGVVAVEASWPVI